MRSASLVIVRWWAMVVAAGLMAALLSAGGARFEPTSSNWQLGLVLASLLGLAAIDQRREVAVSHVAARLTRRRATHLPRTLFSIASGGFLLLAFARPHYPSNSSSVVAGTRLDGWRTSAVANPSVAPSWLSPEQQSLALKTTAAVISLRDSRITVPEDDTAGTVWLMDHGPAGFDFLIRDRAYRWPAPPASIPTIPEDRDRLERQVETVRRQFQVAANDPAVHLPRGATPDVDPSARDLSEWAMASLVPVSRNLDARGWADHMAPSPAISPLLVAEPPSDAGPWFPQFCVFGSPKAPEQAPHEGDGVQGVTWLRVDERGAPELWTNDSLTEPMRLVGDDAFRRYPVELFDAIQRRWRSATFDAPQQTLLFPEVRFFQDCTNLGNWLMCRDVSRTTSLAGVLITALAVVLLLERLRWVSRR